MTVDDACSCFSDGGLESCCVLASDSVFSLSLFFRDSGNKTALPFLYSVFSLFFKGPVWGEGDYNFSFCAKWF
jgi:hypothetical protein